jgi:hypothetical protein
MFQVGTKWPADINMKDPQTVQLPLVKSNKGAIGIGAQSCSAKQQRINLYAHNYHASRCSALISRSLQRHHGSAPGC